MIALLGTEFKRRQHAALSESPFGSLYKNPYRLLSFSMDVCRWPGSQADWHLHTFAASTSSHADSFGDRLRDFNRAFWPSGNANFPYATNYF